MHLSRVDSSAVFHIVARRLRWNLLVASRLRENFREAGVSLALGHPSIPAEIWQTAARDWAEWQKQGCDYLSRDDARFPERLRHIPGAPLGLFFLGDVRALHQPTLAVVGSRQPSALGFQWVERELSEFCAQPTPLTILSGGARGIDMTAHRVAVRKSQSTVVFLPSGLLTPYPRDHVPFFRQLLGLGGLLVSEYLPNEGMQKQFFVERNRLISGASCGVLIVECAERSGTLLTAQAAVDQGRPLWIVPSHPYDMNSKGSLNLLRDGASLVLNASDLSDFFMAEVRISAGLFQNHSIDSQQVLPTH